MVFAYGTAFSAPASDYPAPPPPPPLDGVSVAPQPKSPVAAPGTKVANVQEAEEEEPKDTCRWCRCGALGDPWTLPQPDLLKEAGFNVSGWIQSGVYTNAHGASSNGPLGFNNLTDYNLHQLALSVEKKTDTEKNCWDLGGRIDYFYGIDGPDAQAFGDQSWDYGWNSSSRYGSAIPQLYLELAFGDWSIKGGRFWTAIGNEVVPATGNFFYSHSYACYYAEPSHPACGHRSQRQLRCTGWVDATAWPTERATNFLAASG